MEVHVYKKFGVSSFFLGVFCLLFLLCGASSATSFPFRAISIGDPMPTLTFQGVDGAGRATVAGLKGAPAALVFWGADIETKKERSQKIFEATDSLLPFLEERKIKVLLVNAQGDSLEVIKNAAGGLSEHLPVYTDETKKAYGELGIFVVPSVLLVDAEGNVAAGLGYSHDFKERLRGEVAIMLGEKTRQEVEDSLRPKMKEKTPEEKKIARHLSLALIMKKRGQVDSAITELQNALVVDKEIVEAHGELGCLYLDKGMLEEAKKELDVAYELDSGYLPANICDARVMAEEGQLDEALEDLKILLFRNARNSELHYTIGTLMEKKGDIAEAAREYRKAFELVNREVELDE